MGRYLIVSTDTKDKTVLDGPILADATFNPGPGRQLIDEATAEKQGYTVATVVADMNSDTLAANADFLATKDPTVAQLAAQLEEVTRQNSVIIATLRGQLGDISGL